MANWTVGDVSKHTGWNENSVRNWTKRLGSFLSEQADVENATREYTPRDVAILSAAYEIMNQNGKKPRVKEVVAELKERVAEAEFDDEMFFPGVDIEKLQPADLLQIADEKIRTLEKENQDLREEVIRLETQVQMLEKQGSQTRVEELLQEIAVLKYRLTQGKD